MLNRRRFLQCIVAAATTPPLLQSCSTPRRDRRFRTLSNDPRKIINLAPGLKYNIISKRGRRMSDGMHVPGAHDGMAAFPGENGRIVLVCNHERPGSVEQRRQSTTRHRNRSSGSS